MCRQYIQLAIIPIFFTLGGFIGIAVTSAGELYYVLTCRLVLMSIRHIAIRRNPLGSIKVAHFKLSISMCHFDWLFLRLIDKWDNRAAAFFASFSFMLATLGTNISANSLSAGNDLAALWPKYINIRRGQIICAFVGGWCLCPWEILAK